MFIWFIWNLFVILFNRTTHLSHKIHFELGNNYELEMNVSDIKLVKSNLPPKKKPRNGGMEDSALIPKHHIPRNKPLW